MMVQNVLKENSILEYSSTIIILHPPPPFLPSICICSSNFGSTWPFLSGEVSSCEILITLCSFKTSISGKVTHGGGRSGPMSHWPLANGAFSSRKWLAWSLFSRNEDFHGRELSTLFVTDARWYMQTFSIFQEGPRVPAVKHLLSTGSGVTLYSHCRVLKRLIYIVGESADLFWVTVLSLYLTVI